MDSSEDIKSTIGTAPAEENVESASSDDEEDVGGITNAYSVTDLLGELDDDKDGKSATLQSNKSAKSTTSDGNQNEIPTKPVDPSCSDTGDGRTDGAKSTDDAKSDVNDSPSEDKLDEQVAVAQPQDVQHGEEAPSGGSGDPAHDLYHSPQEVLQRKRESMLRVNGEEHTYYNEPDAASTVTGAAGQGANVSPHGLGATRSATENDYYNVVNPNYRAEPVYNDVATDSQYSNNGGKDSGQFSVDKRVKWAPDSYSQRHADCQSAEEQDRNPPMYLQDSHNRTVVQCSSGLKRNADRVSRGQPSDIYENITHTREGGSSEGGSEEDWASDEFEEYEDNYQSKSGSKGRKGKGPPTLPPRNPEDGFPGKGVADQPLPPTPTSMFDKLAAKLSHRTSRASVEEVEEDSPMMEVMLNLDKHPAPVLGPPPDTLSPLQLKRRHIVASIVESEVSYTASLRTLVEDYEKPLLTGKPEIITRKALRVIFHKVRDILQCHNMFHIELAECVRVWDEQEAIGNIFTASFSKSMVFEAYSEFVNNFSMAMDTAKKQARTKQSFSDFLKHKISTSADKLSLFGLMVKPVQRFPQFIMLLQDLLKQTPHSHHDRLPLQLALTELENLTHKLNETKRESESRHEARRIMANMTGKFSLKPEAERFLVRQDDLMQIEQVNGETKTKQRRLLLLNDHVVCASIVFKESDVGSSEPKYKIKWAVPVSEVEVSDGSAAAPYQVQVGRGKTAVTAVRNKDADKSSDAASQHPFRKELDDMLHDLPLVEQIGQHVNQLRLRYEGITPECIQGLIKTLQLMIHQKCDINKCIIRISVPAKYQAKSGEKIRKEVSKQMNQIKRKHAVHPESPKRGSSRLTFTFQTDTTGAKQDWLLELQNTRLALDPKNNPGWHVPENEMLFTFKLPLFIRPLLIDITKQDTKKQVFRRAKKKNKSKETVQCAIPVLLPGDTPGFGVQHLWVCSGLEGRGKVTVVSLQSNQPHAVESFVACDTLITCCTAVPGFSHCDDPHAFSEDTVWMGANDNRIVIRSVAEENRSDAPRQVIQVENPITCIQYLDNHLYAGLKNGVLLIYGRNQDGVWGVQDKEMLYLGDVPVTCLLQVNGQIWASSGGKVHVVSVTTCHVEGDLYRDQVDMTSHELGNKGMIECMVTAGVGLLVSYKGKSVIQLYHLETFDHLQDVSISSNISKVFEGTELDFYVVSITCLLACRGLLWVGTNIGVVLTLPLPRLEGVPQVKGRPNISYHAHTGPIKFLSPVQCGTLPIPVPVIARPESYPPSEVSCDTSLTDSGSHVAPDADDRDEHRFAQSEDFTATAAQEFASGSSLGGKWTSTPDLRQLELDEHDVATLYGSLLRVDEELEQEIMGPRARRRSRGPHINLSRQVTRFSEAVSNKIIGHTAANPKCSTLPILHEESGSPYSGFDFGRERSGLAAKDSSNSSSSASTRPSEAGEAQSIKSESTSSDSTSGVNAEDRIAGASMAPGRPPLLPTYPGIHSHHQLNKASIIISGGEGHVNWSDKKAAELRYEDICLLLWNCRV